MVWSPCCPGDSQESSPAPQFRGINCSLPHLLGGPTLTAVHDHCKDHCLDHRTFVDRVMSPLFNTLSRFVITFLPRSKHLISFLQSPFKVILEPQKRKYDTTSALSSPICHEIMGLDAMILVFFLVFSFKLALSLSSFTLIKRLFSSYLLSAIRVVSSAYLRLWLFLPPMLIPACNSSSPPFLMMYSEYRVKQYIYLTSKSWFWLHYLCFFTVSRKSPVVLPMIQSCKLLFPIYLQLFHKTYTTGSFLHGAHIFVFCHCFSVCGKLFFHF